ncbi:MAG: hypothetical protein NWF07_04185 [Candidatus Bathyarchaeota archaeon]|nr:hypothetical protein [Candidatus Bathyarchaeota archaeon]
MSGPICPECTTFALIETHGYYSCPICGWSGENPPRKIMDSETSRQIGENTRRLMNLRLNNKLRYVRVELSEDADAQSNAVFEISDIFSPDVIQGDNPVRFFVEGAKVEYIKEIKDIPGVENVSIF